ncbi:MAG TPA: PadR family transcriptional regulator [Candidatus Paceibacterota bacterium]|nr:PadR family transcriptional regulator [Candidatus Paceibacterota bacterium]
MEKEKENKEEFALENTRSQMRKGSLEFIILLIIFQGKVYASDILKRLKEIDLLVVEGTLYPLLSRLKRAELLCYDWEESETGPPRKYYSLTPKGDKVLKNLRKNWDALVESVSLLTKNKK